MFHGLYSQTGELSAVEQRGSNVLLLHVGGTLGMTRVTLPDGSVTLDVQRGHLLKQLMQVDELCSSTMPKYSVVEYEDLKDSSDQGPEDWLRIAKDIETRYYQYDGFLVITGTDTMHFLASALSFLLYNVAKPVIVTGGMLPFEQSYSDSRRNLIVAMLFASTTDICEVCIFCDDVLLRANRCVKLRHSVKSFESPNFPPLAVMQAQKFNLRRDLLLPQPTGHFFVPSDMKARVLLLHVHPDFDIDVVESLLRVDTNPSSILDCIVLELMSFGDANSAASRKLLQLIQVATSVGVVVVVTNADTVGQMDRGSVRRLMQVAPQVVLINDMTSECAVVKAMYLFGKGMSSGDVKLFMPQNLRGELSPVVPTSKL